MNVLHRASLKKRAAMSLQQNPGFRKQVLIHSAVSFGAVIAVMLLQVLLDMVIVKPTGLSGVKTGAFLKAMQSTLAMIVNVLQPFWSLGIFYCAIKAVRRQLPENSDLTQGFRNWGVVLRYNILLVGLGFVVTMALTNVMSISMVAVSPVYTAIFPIPEGIDMVALEKEMMEILTSPTADPMQMLAIIPKELFYYVLPLSILFAVAACVVIVHLCYRIRFSEYILMDGSNARARGAIFLSNRMTKGYKWELFKLDLSFWWYYLLLIIASTIGELPQICALLGWNLPVSGTVANLTCIGVSCLCSILVTWSFGPQVHLTHACAYDMLRQQIDPPEES